MILLSRLDRPLSLKTASMENPVQYGATKSFIIALLDRLAVNWGLLR